MSRSFLQSRRRWLALALAAWAAGHGGPAGWAQEVAEVEVEWKPRFQGVDTAELRAGAPRRVRGVALRIDLQAEGVSFLATPANGEKPGETDAQLTSAFLAEHRLQAAINGAPFDIIHEKPGEPQDVHGLLVSDGRLVSAAGNAPALVIDRNNRARIVNRVADLPADADAKSPGLPKGAWNAVGGFAVVLRDGEPTGRGDATTHPRTAVGLSKDGRWMYWAVIDGRQFGHSLGVTTAELAALLKRLGASDGINLDGGGTSTLVVAGPDGAPQILNRPVHRGIPGNERLSACHLGLRAKPLPKG